MKYVVGFGQFWWDFIVGDSAALAVGGVAVLILGAGLVRIGYPIAAEVALPSVVIATLAGSLYAGKR
jgi:hypothetical protein